MAKNIYRASKIKLPFDFTFCENLVQQNSITPPAERQIKQKYNPGD